MAGQGTQPQDRRADADVERDRRADLKRKTKRMLAIVASVYLAVCVLVFVFQRRLIYMPGRDIEFTPTDVGLAYDEVRLRTNDGVMIVGWYAPADLDGPGPGRTVLYFHGNAGNISGRLPEMKTWVGLGYDVFMVDYRGYGLSEGSPSETGLYVDAEAAWAYLVKERGRRPEQIVIVGRSLGGAVAIELATRHRPAALVVESTFTSFPSVGQRQFRLLPVKLLMRDRFDSISKVGRISCPKVFTHGTDDRLIPIAMGRKLYEAARPPKLFIETPGGHNGAGMLHSDVYTKRVAEFLKDAQVEAAAESAPSGD